MKKKICIVTGGTGGHIFPALALAGIWKQTDPEVSLFFIGNDDRMEKDLVPAEGYPFFSVHAKGFAGSWADKATALMLQLSARNHAHDILKQEKPDLVIGFGGYVSAPVLAAAKSLHIPVMVHEQNSVVGKSNKMAARKADAIVTCYPEAKFDHPNVRLLGNPRASYAVMDHADRDYFLSLGLKPDKKTLLIVMGSLGSASVNTLMQDALKGLSKQWQVLYVCGKDNSGTLDLFPDNPDIHTVEFVNTLKIYPFIEGMICRAGATTLAEVCALAIPSIIIPSPYVAENHQYYNAKKLADEHAALMIEEKDLNAKTLREAIETGFENEENRQAMAENARKLGAPNAAQDMIDWAEQLMD
jgi:UDP-N-acetylglucosamine--N-acetylmuramyl-(pentapeptide) pyrophosphoryl-undecaprenol N-acetylglucosamine transferase